MRSRASVAKESARRSKLREAEATLSATEARILVVSEQINTAQRYAIASASRTSPVT